MTIRRVRDKDPLVQIGGELMDLDQAWKYARARPVEIERKRIMECLERIEARRGRQQGWRKAETREFSL